MEKREPEISVIVPVYKAEKYLDRCVRSILGQTFDDFELILVEDGSPDNSLRICRTWAERDDRIHVFHKENGGASSAKNLGLQNAKGKFITFVDSDDWIETRMMERLLELIRQYDADMCLTDFQSNNGSQKTRQKSQPIIEIWGRKECLDRFFRIKGEDSHYYAHSCLFRRDFLRGFSFIEGRMNEDVLSNYWIALHCRKAVHTDEVFYNYFQNGLGVTQGVFTKKKLDLLEVWKVIEKMVPDLTPEYIDACNINMKRAYFTLLCRMYIDGYDRKDPELRQIKKDLKCHVRKYFWDLFKWRMPVSRKILLCLVAL